MAIGGETTPTKILTTAEKDALNDISQRRDANVTLGNIINGILESLAQPGTPLNADYAWASITFTGVVVDGETVTVNNPAVPGIDVYEFLADLEQTKTALANIAVDISSVVVPATGTLTMDTQPTSGDKVTIGSKVYTFVPVGTDTADGEISIGADLAGAQVAFVSAINGTDGKNVLHPLVMAGAFAGNISTIIARVGGSAGNLIATTETFTAATNVFAATALGSGEDCSSVDAISALVAAVTASDTQGVYAEAGENNDIIISAEVFGDAGNDITISETFTNASINAGETALSGGVNGTVAAAGTMRIAPTGLYVCIADNGISDANWNFILFGTGK